MDLKSAMHNTILNILKLFVFDIRPYCISMSINCVMDEQTFAHYNASEVVLNVTPSLEDYFAGIKTISLQSNPEGLGKYIPQSH